MDVLASALHHLERTAVVQGGVEYRYDALLAEAAVLAQHLRSAAWWPARSAGSSAGPRVALYLPPGPQYVSATWAAWLAGGTAVPLCLVHPDRELLYVLQDSGASVLLTSADAAARLRPLAQEAGAALQVLPGSSSNGGGSAGSGSARGYGSGGGSGAGGIRGSGDGGGAADAGALREEVARLRAGANADDGCLIIYTSGTTGRPKGALHTHRSIGAQVAGLASSWGMSPSDRLLHTLPLHHIHGIVNALHLPHFVGAAVEFEPKFSPARVWDAVMREHGAPSVFMGVPTMYAYLLSHYDAMPPERQEAARAAAARLRLAVSGSAACPLPILKRWTELAGAPLLERYGMTETGMILSNPLHGERRPGSVGLPLPGVAVKLADTADKADAAEDGGESGGEGSAVGSGELLVSGGSLFREYWGRPDATAEAFGEEGYFRTGDIAVCDGDPPYWRLLGRASADIIKTRGYKVSALHVESALLEHPAVAEVAVLGLPHDVLGEAVAAVVAPVDGAAPPTLEELQAWARERLPPYQAPERLLLVDAIPRNAMGKVNKKELRSTLFGGGGGAGGSGAPS